MVQYLHRPRPQECQKLGGVELLRLARQRGPRINELANGLRLGIIVDKTWIPDLPKGSDNY
jgi:hypothetical protein